MSIESDKRQWHIGKEIPVAVMLVIGLQTAAGLWWVSTLGAVVTELVRKVTVLEAKADAAASRMSDISSATQVTGAKTEGISQQLGTLQTQVEFMRQDSVRRAETRR